MEKFKNVENKVKRLLSMQSGPKMARYNAVAAILHVSPRHVMSLSIGQKRASHHLALFIDDLFKKI